MILLTGIILITGLIIMDQPATTETRHNEPGSMAILKSPDFILTGNGQAHEWDNAEWEDIPQRNNMETVEYPTRVKVLYSESGIYFLFNCGDRIINSTLQADNLKLWEEDVVEVFLMPDEKYPLYFEYQLSPLNYELTILIPNLEGNFLGWLPWQYEGERMTRHETSVIKNSQGNVEGWIAEFFIPWKLLTPLITGPPKKGEKWKANMYRLDYDKGLTRFSWQKTDINFHEPHNFGTFIFD
jgi:hypothetical protein